MVNVKKLALAKYQSAHSTSCTKRLFYLVKINYKYLKTRCITCIAHCTPLFCFCCKQLSLALYTHNSYMNKKNEKKISFLLASTSCTVHVHVSSLSFCLSSLSFTSMACLHKHNRRAQCKNGLSDDFGPPFTKPPNYLLSCNVAVAK